MTWFRRLLLLTPQRGPARFLGRYVPATTRLLAVFIVLAGTGCGVDVVPSPGTPEVKYQNVAYARQPNSRIISGRTFVEAFDFADQKFRKAHKTLGIKKIRNDFEAPPIQAYLGGTNCDKWYFDPATCSGNCNGYANPEEGYATGWRNDVNNPEHFTDYHVLLITEEVVAAEPNGFLLAVTSPRNSDPLVTLRCSFVFDEQIYQWLYRAEQDPSSGYSYGGRPGYAKYMVNWAVAHELGHQVGALSHFAEQPFQHVGSERDDIMGTLFEGDPKGDYYKVFCSFVDTIPSNSCADRLKERFP